MVAIRFSSLELSGIEIMKSFSYSEYSSTINCRSMPFFRKFCI
jgi:hypothetical protein